jgi:hypothetical protein
MCPHWTSTNLLAIYLKRADMPDHEIVVMFAHYSHFTVVEFGHLIRSREAAHVSSSEPYVPLKSDWPLVGPILEALFKVAGQGTEMSVDVTYKSLTVNDPPRSLWGDCLEPVVLGCLTAAGISYTIKP